MISTSELRTELTAFTAIMHAALGPRVRVQRVEEGWPFVQGRTGRLEWRGIEAGGGRRVYAFTDHPKVIARLCAVPGVHRHQIGDQEAAVWIAAEDQSALQAVAALFHTRIRRAPMSAAQLTAARSTGAQALARYRASRSVPNLQSDQEAVLATRTPR